MGSTVKALKEFGKKCNTEHMEPDGTTISKVINNIAEDFDITGASVAAITLYSTEGAVTGGIATLTDGTEIEITVTSAPTPSP